MRISALWHRWADAVLPHVIPPGSITLIDGRSGVGKSTFASVVERTAHDAGHPVTLIRAESIYPGWDGLDEAARIIAEQIVEPLRLTGHAAWPTYDWATKSVGATATASLGRPVIIEGCGALTRASAAHATYRIWLEGEPTVRQARALARDGETYRPHWQRWARQEERLLKRESSPALADVTIHVPDLFND
jgi:uridine kinase